MAELSKEVEYTAEVPVESTLALARFASRRPENPRAVLVMVPGSNGDGRFEIYDRHWVRFAEEENLGLVGCFFQDKILSPIEGYIKVQQGSGDCLLKALEAFRLDHLPILMWGFSAGGEYNYEFTCWLTQTQPGRVAAFVVNKGGIYCTALAPEAARKVPGIFFIGDQDAMFRRSILQGIWSMNVAVGAVWEKHHEDVGHIPANSESVAKTFFADTLRRLEGKK